MEKDGLINSDNVGIEDESIDGSLRNGEVALQQQKHQGHSSQCKWNEEKEVNVGALQTLRGSQSKAESRFAGSTQDTRAIEHTLIILIPEAEIAILWITVVKGTIAMCN